MKKISQHGKVSFPQAVKDFYQGYFDFRGRTTLAGYWWVTLAAILAYVFLFILTGILTGTSEYGSPAGTLMVFIILLFTLSLIIPLITLSIRRLRDTGLKSKTILTIYILYYAFYVTFMMSFYSSILNSMSSIYSNYSDSYEPAVKMIFSGSPLITFLFIALSVFMNISVFLPTDMWATESNNPILTSIFSKKA